MRGASLTDVKEILGHADMKTTLRYAHLSPAHLRTGSIAWTGSLNRRSRQ
jgi:site-specific recombinase XerD